MENEKRWATARVKVGNTEPRTSVTCQHRGVQLRLEPTKHYALPESLAQELHAKGLIEPYDGNGLEDGGDARGDDVDLLLA